MTKGFAAAQDRYAAAEPPSGDWPRCKCGEDYEDHEKMRVDGEHLVICPDAYDDMLQHRYAEADEPEDDPDRRRDERDDR